MDFNVLIMAWRIWGMGNHRLVEVRRDLWWSSSPTSLIKQGPVEHVTQILCRQLLTIIREESAGATLDNLFRVFNHLHSKEVFPHVQTEHHLPLLNFKGFLCAHFSSLSRCFWMAAQHYGVVNHSSQFCIITRLAEEECYPFIQIIDENVKQYWTQY